MGEVELPMTILKPYAPGGATERTNMRVLREGKLNGHDPTDTKKESCKLDGERVCKSRDGFEMWQLTLNASHVVELTSMLTSDEEAYSGWCENVEVFYSTNRANVLVCGKTKAAKRLLAQRVRLNELLQKHKVSPIGMVADIKYEEVAKASNMCKENGRTRVLVDPMVLVTEFMPRSKFKEQPPSGESKAVSAVPAGLRRALVDALKVPFVTKELKKRRAEMEKVLREDSDLLSVTLEKSCKEGHQHLFDVMVLMFLVHPETAGLLSVE